MTDSTTAAATEKVVEKITGALERLVDVRMLVLSMSFLMYLDIWLVMAGFDPNQMTIDDGIGRMKLLSIGDVAMFFVSYSLMMSVTIPAIRKVYVVVMSIYGPDRGDSRRQSIEERQLSRWSLGFVVFTAWDALAGYFSHAAYPGAALFLFNRLAGDGPAIIVFRVSAAIFALVCASTAFERDG